ncbi:hypothetical protein BN439_0287 [Erwinia amylovora Ea644]|uniref:Uncharacterized protein n=2 Tax=Erwinia amylovora TaxID=552 RepID=A0A830ZXP5_ERWAM|nr:hypothetical protein EaACW_0278 [Erwinia amylovora ACW56400]QJQ56003.1 hypothetical protein EHX00_3304 [Erwinia amylovora]CBA19214.1 hypothetical protein predicted by Glimmer/Critica [Erwinia amylovora CFBP1430]CCO77123.1 hypothetical protein BN432_0288 [Erwinia amylovora Ea356]CCO80905.1 hypothetical protein BN433_0296 [Erwinia amylovora Ea266]CCO84710.1 hypothetical protein BN434_0285 [Erwinia amylovora CFBP 2585]CCO88498.1 hypothetical protein BN435_0288 [Erwinia amylovora 01SFR-BO]CCO
MVPHHRRAALNKMQAQAEYAVPALSSRHMFRLRSKLA